MLKHIPHSSREKALAAIKDGPLEQVIEPHSYRKRIFGLPIGKRRVLWMREGSLCEMSFEEGEWRAMLDTMVIRDQMRAICERVNIDPAKGITPAVEDLRGRKKGAMLEQVVLEIQGGLGPFFIRVPLPYNDLAKWSVEDQLDRAHIRMFVKKEELEKFKRRLEWLPTTQDQLGYTNELRESGLDYHTAAARSLGYSECGCPDCQKVKTER
jgi:hypothetical protein